MVRWYKGRLSGVDLATITERGIYYVKFDCTNLPDSFADYFPNSSAFLLVLPYGTDDEGKGISLTQVIFGLTTTMEGPGGNLITPYPYDTADMYARNIYYHEAYGAAIDQPWTKINDFKQYFEKYLHNEYVNKTDSYTAQYDNGDGSYEFGGEYTFQDIVNAIDSLGAKSDKTTILTSTETTPTRILNHNEEIRYDTVESITLTLPEEKPNDYISSVIFTSGEIVPSFTAEGIIMCGDECEVGVFTPEANKRYTVIVSYDGVNIIGDVRGVSI